MGVHYNNYHPAFVEGDIIWNSYSWGRSSPGGSPV